MATNANASRDPDDIYEREYEPLGDDQAFIEEEWERENEDRNYDDCYDHQEEPETEIDPYENHFNPHDEYYERIEAACERFCEQRSSEPRQL